MAHRRIVWLSLLVAGFLVCDRSAEQAIQPTAPFNVYFGNLHKHFDLFYPWITTRLDTTGRVPIVQLNLSAA